MTAAEVAFKARLERRALQMSPDLARRYIEAYKLIRGALNPVELERAIRNGTLDAFIEDLVYDDPGLDPKLASLRARLDQMVVDVGKLEAKHLPTWLRPRAFGVLNPAVVEAARAFDGAALRTLTQDVEEMVRTAVTRGLEAGKNPRAIAREIPQSVGLNGRQWDYVANFRRELLTGDRSALDRMLGKGQLETAEGKVITRKAHAGGEGLSKAQLRLLDKTLGKGELTPDQVESMVEAYRRRLIALNTEAHVKTQTLQAQKVGQRMAWEEAISRGVVERSALGRKWLTTLDGREREEHHDLHGTVVGFDEPFPNGEITPGESTYNCRCVAKVFVRRVQALITIPEMTA